MEFVLGFLGAVIGVMLLGIVGAAGWIIRGVYDEQRHPECPPPGETERKRLAEQQRMEKALAAERLLAVLRVFHDDKDDMDIAAMYIAKLKERNEKSKLEKAYAAIEKINKKKK